MEKRFINLEKALLVYADLIKKDFVSALIANGKNGKIDKTMFFTVEVANNIYTLVLHIEPYYKYIERGRKPGTFPNVDALVKWINQKKLIPVNSKTIKPKQLAFLIGRKIKRDGIKPLPILSKAIRTANKTFYNELQKALLLDLKQMLNN